MHIADLSEHPRNVEIRQHPEPGSARWETLKASLRHDYFDPMVWNVRNGHLVSGHLRRKVFLSLGYEQADVVVVDYDEPTHLARMMAANKLMGDDNFAGQKALLIELKDVPDFEFSLTGFTLPEFDLLDDAGVGLGDNDGEGEQAPTGSLPEEVLQVIRDRISIDIQVQRGEVYACGPHRVYCANLLTDKSWVFFLAENPNMLFLPVADPYMLVNSQTPPAVVVQPDSMVASMIVSNYRRVHGDAEVAIVAN